MRRHLVYLSLPAAAMLVFPLHAPAQNHPYASAKPIPEAVKFAPGIVSTPQTGCVTFSPDGRTVYFAHHTPPPSRLMTSRFENGAWTAPEPVPFSGPDSGRDYDGDPALAPDGSRLFFASKKAGEKRMQIWSARRQGSGWSDPQPVADGLCGPSVASDGTLYFCGDKPDSRGGLDIYRARLVNGVYSAPENLGDGINSPGDDYDAYIAPDQSYLIFASGRASGKGFYVSYRNGDQWTPARLLPAISPGVCPVVSPDRRYFFFTSESGVNQIDLGALNLRR